MEISKNIKLLVENVFLVQKNLKNEYLRNLNLAEHNMLTQLIDATIQLIKNNVVKLDTGYWFETNNFYNFELAQFKITNEDSQLDDIPMFYTAKDEDQIINWVMSFIFELWESEIQSQSN